MIPSIAIASVTLLVGLLLVGNAWLFIGTYWSALALAAVLDVSLVIATGYEPAGGILTQLLTMFGGFVLTLGLFVVLYGGVALGLAQTHRFSRTIASRLLSPVDITAVEEDIDTDSDNPDFSSAPWRYRVAVRVHKFGTFCDTVATDYFYPNSTKVGSNPWYYRLLQRRAYFHADVDEVNFHLRWLDDHHKLDEDAEEHVRALQKELETNELWSP